MTGKTSFNRTHVLGDLNFSLRLLCTIRCQLTHHSHVRTHYFAPRHERVPRFFDAIAYDSRYPFKNLKGFFFRNFPPLSRSTALWHHLAIAVVYVQLVFLPSRRSSPHRRKWLQFLHLLPRLVQGRKAYPYSKHPSGVRRAVYTKQTHKKHFKKGKG